MHMQFITTWCSDCGPKSTGSKGNISIGEFSKAGPSEKSKLANSEQDDSNTGANLTVLTLLGRSIPTALLLVYKTAPQEPVGVLLQNEGCEDTILGAVKEHCVSTDYLN